MGHNFSRKMAQLQSPGSSYSISVTILSSYWNRTAAEAEAPILGHLMWRADSLEKTLILGKIEGRRRRGAEGEMAR